MTKEKTILYGGISKTPEERAEILYNHPDNERKEKIIERHIIEYIPVVEPEPMPNMFKRNFGIMPVEYTEAPQKTYSRDLKKERRDRVNEIRAQKRINSFEKSKNPKERMDYINKPSKPYDISFGLNPDTYAQSDIKMRGKNLLTPKKDYKQMAEMFYPEMEEESQIKTNLDKEYNNPVQIHHQPENTKNTDIFDVEKTLFPNGMMGEMPLQPIKEEGKPARNNKTKRDYEEIANVLYPTIPENAEIMKLKETAKAEEREIEKERWLTHVKNFGGAALMIGSGAIPAARGIIIASQAGKTAVAYLTPIIGKYYAEKIVPMIIMDGIAGGGLFNLGHGMLTNKERLLIEMLKGAVIGMFTVPMMELALIKILEKIPKDRLIEYINTTLKTGKNSVEYTKGGIRNVQQRESTSEFIRRVRKIYQRNDERLEAYEKRSGIGNGGTGTGSNGRIRLGLRCRLNGFNGRVLEEVYIPKANFKKAFALRKYKPFVYYELKSNIDESAEIFYDSMLKAKKELGENFTAVYIYPQQEYKNMRLFLSENRQSGFAIKDDGDIVSVFSFSKENGTVHSMMELAIQEGGKKLDCFDTYLPGIYKSHGFKEVKRVKWNEQEKPADWDKEYFKKYNKGEPDVVYMELEK